MATSVMTDLSDVGVRPSKPRQEPGVSATRTFRLAEMWARVALGSAFLSSVADRFGLWGSYGHKNVSWGDFAHFVQYTGMVNSFLPARMIPALAWMATCAETVFGVCLILGIYRRIVAVGSAALLLMFALAMSVSLGVKSAIDYAVFSASSSAFLLVAMHQMALRKNNAEKSLG
jgi:uncharacterized membrane protein YphA (DoxX/SURF4 family)